MNNDWRTYKGNDQSSVANAFGNKVDGKRTWSKLKYQPRSEEEGMISQRQSLR